MPEHDERARRRAFIRANHPDVGGDPDAFAAGLAAFGSSRADGGRAGQLTFVRSTRLRHRLARAVRGLTSKGRQRRRRPPLR